MDNPIYDAEHCYECTGYGDDYYVDDKGEMICRCCECEFAPYYEED